jgi:hypothetical protein
MLFCLITITHFEDRLADVKMTLLNKAISVQVIAGNANVVDVILLAEVLED